MYLRYTGEQNKNTHFQKAQILVGDNKYGKYIISEDSVAKKKKESKIMAIFKSGARVNLTEKKVTFEQRRGRGKGGDHADMWGKSTQAKKWP